MVSVTDGRRTPGLDQVDRLVERFRSAGLPVSVSVTGAVTELAPGLDLTNRTKFPGKSLDHWMRAMWRQHSDVDRPYTHADLERTLGSVTGSAGFAHEIFARYINGTETIDYVNLLPKGGFAIR